MLATYITRITAAAILCGIITGLSGKKGSASTIIRTLCGVFLTISLIQPFVQFKIESIADYFEDFEVQSDALTAQGELMWKKELGDIIKSKTEAYILDKAQTYGADIQVEVSVDSSSIPVPTGVKISGTISPYGKRQLQQVIADDLGIATEAQTWT